MSLAKLGFSIVSPLLQGMDAERAHGVTINALKVLPAIGKVSDEPTLAQDIFGLKFATPLGLAAGFDKNAEVPNAMLGLGFGFVEVGTVTPKPQTGNAKPRLFRLREDQAVINRMGFNNEGHDVVMRNLASAPKRGIIGVNIGANKDAADRTQDYVLGLERFARIADYITINVSSPNTPGLRGLQNKLELDDLLSRLVDARGRVGVPVPMLLKIAPDLDAAAIADIAGLVVGRIDGVIISNTTIARPALRSAYAAETGGLSGAPLFEPATRVLAEFYQSTSGKIPLIGAGGISDAETAWKKMRAGASLLQLYSALVYSGPSLITEINRGLAAKLKQSGARHLSEIVGLDSKHYQSAAGT